MSRKAFPIVPVRISSSGGFTLLEVLLAMAILAVIMTVIYASFSSAENSIQQAEAIRDETDLARSLLTRLSQDVANAYIRQSTELPTVFCGKKIEDENPSGGDKLRHDSISLTTVTNFPRPGTKEMELWEVGYFFKEKSEGKGYALYRREKRELSKDSPVLEGGAEYELTDRVQSMQIRYLSGPFQAGSGATQNWADGWNLGGGQACTSGSSSISTSSTLPTIVEITVTLDNGKVYSTQVDVLNRVQA